MLIKISLLCFSMIYAPLTLAQTTYLEVEPNHSTVGFSVDIAGGLTRVTGKFTEYKIELDYVDRDITRSSVRVEIQAASIQTGIPDRDAHLRTADFFDVEQHPLIIFTSERIWKEEDQYLIEGPFTMRGVTRTLQLPFEVTGMDGNTLGFALEMPINRIDFGVGAEFVHTAIDNFLADEVDVHVYFWTRKKRTPKQ
ncbi:MAG: YceI family protein [Saprospiraceae bacterium]|nr:YceI family protein [Saprospiraceae bacterium]